MERLYEGEHWATYGDRYDVVKRMAPGTVRASANAHRYPASDRARGGLRLSSF